ncbi:SDR family oxidoreductase [Aliiroseovarius sp.]|uniref:SDR family oxidoreductase n=1 Tax=Aliiroseovarius sp. TaxID=1872442 RepID=UPI00260B5D77|nr:SDR family oxidoreductase [Aliiroseovarius sp.]
MTTLITGANRGIGRALHDAYGTRGEEVIGTARSGDGFEPLEVSDPASQAALARRLGGRGIDLLVCNAGIYPDKGMMLEGGFAPEVWAEAFAVNVTGVFLTIQTLLPNLRKAGGKVAILSSIMASSAQAPGGAYAYRASKAAVLNLGRNLARDLAPERIAVGIYHPGWVRTDMGGEAADIDVTQARDGLMARFDALSPETTGCFESYDGTALPF